MQCMFIHAQHNILIELIQYLQYILYIHPEFSLDCTNCAHSRQDLVQMSHNPFPW